MDRRVIFISTASLAVATNLANVVSASRSAFYYIGPIILSHVIVFGRIFTE